MNKSRSGYPFSLAAVVLTALLAASANAGLITVKSGADAGGTCPGATCTLRQAIATAVAGDSINFAVGLTKIELTSDELLINKNLTISGPGANVLSIQRNAAAGTPNLRIFDVVGNTVTLSGLTIANGLFGDLGAGLRHDGGTLNVTSCTISGNTVNAQSGNFGNGGGIYNSPASGILTITGSTIFDNKANNSAGGILNDGALTINNCTVFGNSTIGGGGIYSRPGSTATITNSTISGNTATGQGGGIRAFSGTVTVRNTIIARNTSSEGPDVNGILTSQGYNVIGDDAFTTIVPKTGDQIGTTAAPINPLLGPLQDNGGPTMTLALLSGSSAIEGGDSGGASTDQRGLARPVDSSIIANVGDGSDIGAYEVQADVLPGCSNINKVVSNANDSGANSLRGVIAAVCAGSTITFAPNVTGLIPLTSAELLVNKSLTIVGPGANVLGDRASTSAGTTRFPYL